MDASELMHHYEVTVACHRGREYPLGRSARVRWHVEMFVPFGHDRAPRVLVRSVDTSAEAVVLAEDLLPEVARDIHTGYLTFDEWVDWYGDAVPARRAYRAWIDVTGLRLDFDGWVEGMPELRRDFLGLAEQV